MSVDFEVCCDKCGSNLNVKTQTLINSRGVVSLDVDPCKDCIEDARGDGVIEGREEAKKNAD